MTSLCRHFCTKTLSSQQFSVLSTSLQKDAKRVASLIDDARQAISISTIDNSDDNERQIAIDKVKYAINHYVQLVSRGDPPIQLKPNAQPKSESQSPIENDITKLLGEQVSHMKQEIFKSNRQRVWIGWYGFF